MYITYCRNQQSLDPEDTTQYRLNTAAGEYRPTYLIRVSDWKKVPGHKAKSGYCALSYVWAQSGEVIQLENGEYKCIDNKGHSIIDGFDMNNGDSVSMTETEHGEYEWKVDTKSATIRHVTYEELLQQMCKDFQIEYLWYDKECIDQSNKKLKQREIKQMHLIYGNACYTVAMIPEAHVRDSRDFNIIDQSYGDTRAAVKVNADVGTKSLWWKRSWTLEETMSSKYILMCGTNTHRWHNSLFTCDIPTNNDVLATCLLDFVNQQEKGGVNVALSQAHFRTSSKEHDKVFSLANVFHHMFEDIEVTYEIDIKAAFDHFYQTIATHDLSILCFGSNFSAVDLSEIKVNTMKKHQLPSWTGVSGCHIKARVLAIATLLQSPHYICKNMLLHIPTKYYKILSIVPYEHGCFSPLYHSNRSRFNYLYTILSRYRELFPQIPCKLDFTLMDWSRFMVERTLCEATHYYQPKHGFTGQARPLSLTEDCEECIILPILLKSTHLRYNEKTPNGLTTLYTTEGYFYEYFLPVFKKCGDCTNTKDERYRAIGIYYLGDDDDWDFNSDSLENILKSAFGEEIAHNEVKEFIVQ